MIRRYLTEEKEEHVARRYVAWGMVIFTLLILLFIPLVPPPKNLTGFAIQDGGAESPIGGVCGCADVNQDGEINLIDYDTVVLRYGACQGSVQYTSNADINHDGCIDDSDLACLRSGALRPSRC